MKRFILLISCIIICFTAAGIGAAATIPQIPTWYAGLHKPSFNPPNYLFGPVWSVLYLLMAIALFLFVIKETSRSKAHGYTCFTVQLVLNALWSVLFFGYHQLFSALILIAVLLVFIVLTIRYFARIVRPAAIMLLPYLIWVTFAAVLNFAIWRLN